MGRVIACNFVPPPAAGEAASAVAPKEISAENFQQMAGVDISHQEEPCDCGAFSIVGAACASGNAELGSLELKWSRSSEATAGKMYSAVVNLSAIPLSQPPLEV